MIQVAPPQQEQVPPVRGRHPSLWAIAVGILLLVGALLYFVHRRFEYVLISLWWAAWIYLAWKGLLRKHPGQLLFGTTAVLSSLGTIALTTVPFYANGLHLRPERDIRELLVDVKYQAPFIWEWCGGPLLESARLLHFTTPIIVTMTGLLFFWSVTSDWHTIHRQKRALLISVVGLVLMIYVISLKDWELLSVWLMD